MATIDARPACARLAAAFALVAMVACGGDTSAAVDGGHHDSASPSQDASRDRGASDAGRDTGHLDAGSHDTGKVEAAMEAGSDVSLDAALSGLDIPPACGNCLGANCVTQANQCAMTMGCKAIEACTLACVHGGTAPMTCAVRCIEGEAGIPDGGPSPAQAASEALSLCIGKNCSGDCI